MKEGEIYIVPFTSSIGHEFQKIRPVIVLKQSSYIFTCVPLTSNISNKLKGDIMIYKNNINNLLKDSLVKIRYISTFDVLRIHKYIGKVDTNIMKDIQQSIRSYLTL